MSQSTIPEAASHPGEGAGEPQFGFVVLWCPAEPDRVGAWLPIQRGVWILGRGGALATDAHPRLPIVRQRPGRNVIVPPFECAALSRVQVLVTRDTSAEVRIERTGRCRISVDGQEQDEALVREGAVVQVGQQLVLLSVERRGRLMAHAEGEFPFGAPDADGLVGESPAIWDLREKLSFMGRRPGHVLVLGDSGVGKELAANALHRISGRRGAMLSRNATTFPETLLDAELFGNAEGYPNPGMRERKGLVGAADRGTLFLDEFGELPMAQQAHLLRVLDAGEYQRLGESTVRRTDLRLVAATNRPLSVFRKDVLARFEHTIVIPELASRREDVPLLVRRLLMVLAEQDTLVRDRFFEPQGEPRVSPRLIATLVRHLPEGNLRGLRKELWRAIERSTGNVIEAPEPTSEGQSPSPSSPAEIDARKLRLVLDATGGSMERARRELGLSSRFVLIRLMKKHGIKVRKTASDS
jgi:two-component system nitrogen regulation response regulator GlnG/two-component system response regulator HydG